MNPRTLTELTNVSHPAWNDISETIAQTPIPVMVLPTETGGETLYSLQVTIGSALGALAYNCGGILIDHGWVRLLGGGTSGLPSLATINNLNDPAKVTAPPAYLVIGFDVLGGCFAIDGGGLGIAPGEVCYFAPDTLGWEPLSLGHGAFVQAFLSGATTKFYDSFRWPGWEEEVAQLQPDQGLSLFPPPSTREGQDLAMVTRRKVPIAELLDFYGVPGADSFSTP